MRGVLRRLARQLSSSRRWHAVVEAFRRCDARQTHMQQQQQPARDISHSTATQLRRHGAQRTPSQQQPTTCRYCFNTTRVSPRGHAKLRPLYYVQYAKSCVMIVERFVVRSLRAPLWCRANNNSVLFITVCLRKRVTLF